MAGPGATAATLTNRCERKHNSTRLWRSRARRSDSRTSTSTGSDTSAYVVHGEPE